MNLETGVFIGDVELKLGDELMIGPFAKFVVLLDTETNSYGVELVGDSSVWYNMYEFLRDNDPDNTTIIGNRVIRKK